MASSHIIIRTALATSLLAIGTLAYVCVTDRQRHEVEMREAGLALLETHLANAYLILKIRSALPSHENDKPGNAALQELADTAFLMNFQVASDTSLYREQYEYKSAQDKMDKVTLLIHESVCSDKGSGSLSNLEKEPVVANICSSKGAQ